MGRKYTIGFTLIEVMIVVLVIGILLGIAIPNFVHAREQSRQHACIANLIQIKGAKDQWAFEEKKSDTATPTDADLFGDGKYITVKPSCAKGGTYTLRRVNQNPRCTYRNDPDFPHFIAALNED